MNLTDPTLLQRPLHLAPGRALRLSPLAESGRHDPRRLWARHAVGGVTLQVLRGAVWLTWPGGEGDVFLHAGQSVDLPPAPWGSPLATVDGVLVEAEPLLSLAPAVVRLVERHPLPLGASLGAVLRTLGT